MRESNASHLFPEVSALCRRDAHLEWLDTSTGPRRSRATCTSSRKAHIPVVRVTARVGCRASRNCDPEAYVAMYVAGLGTAVPSAASRRRMLAARSAATVESRRNSRDPAGHPPQRQRIGGLARARIHRPELRPRSERLSRFSGTPRRSRRRRRAARWICRAHARANRPVIVSTCTGTVPRPHELRIGSPRIRTTRASSTSWGRVRRGLAELAPPRRSRFRTRGHVPASGRCAAPPSISTTISGFS